MAGIIWLIVMGLSIWLLNSRKSAISSGQVVEQPMTGGEKVWTWVLCFFNPLITGAILYYGWKKKLPVKAKQANQISFMVFGLQFAFVILLAVVRARTRA